jgi:beta-glucanase (GH16 family)
MFDDEFNGTGVNTTSWSTDNGYTNQNNATDSSNNVSVTDGCAVLRLASATSGAEMTTNTVGLKVGDFAQARIQFAGSGTTVDNWPAFWTAGPGWPASGEQDIFEGLGTATTNYHYAVDGNNTQAGPFLIPGDWAGSFHSYGIYRGKNYCDVYWDGQLVKTYSTDDNAGLEYLLLTEGAANTLSFGASGQMLVDYVRVWQPT